jgi:hypothetical protein
MTTLHVQREAAIALHALDSSQPAEGIAPALAAAVLAFASAPVTVF